MVLIRILQLSRFFQCPYRYRSTNMPRLDTAIGCNASYQFQKEKRKISLSLVLENTQSFAFSRRRSFAYDDCEMCTVIFLLIKPFVV